MDGVLRPPTSTNPCVAGPSPTCFWFYFQMTNPTSDVQPCFSVAILAQNLSQAKQLAEYENGGYKATAIDAAAYSSGNACAT